MSTATGRGYGPRRRVVDEVMRRVRTGVWSPGHQLPGEHQLAAEFDVSRGTIRNALTELNERHVITTKGGVGSFVTYDGVGLGERDGWARALHRAGLPVRTELVATVEHEPVEIGAAGASGPTVLFERRRLLDDRVVSLERSFLPATEQVRAAARDGLPGGSITALLRAAGLVAHHGFQEIGARPLDEREAPLLRRPAGTLLLASTRVTLAADGGLVERVESVLDPEHFRFSLDFTA